MFGGDQEEMTLDGGFSPYYGAVEASGTAMTFPRDPDYPQWCSPPSTCRDLDTNWTGSAAYVIGGQGQGQLRVFAKGGLAEGLNRTWQLATPFGATQGTNGGVPLGADSFVSVFERRERCIYRDNLFEDGGPMQLYGGMWHAVVANNSIVRAEGLIVEGLNHPDGLGKDAFMPCYFVETLSNRVIESLTYTGSVAGLSASGYFNASKAFSGAMVAAIVYRGNFLDNGHWSVSGAVQDVLIEGNTMINTQSWNNFTVRQGQMPNKTAGNTTSRIFLRNNVGMPATPLIKSDDDVNSSPPYPACSSDSDCYDHPLYRCVGCRYNASQPAGVCFPGNPAAKATCQCKDSAPGDQCGPTNFKPSSSSQLPSYLMVGDSISIGMVNEGKLFQQLNMTVQAAHSPGNACNANRGAHCIDNWLDSCKFDIVSFNFGIHDISHSQEHMTLPVYTTLLTQITQSLLKCRQSNGTKLLYVLTAPVPTIEGNASKSQTNCIPSDVAIYNEAAKTIMAAAKVPTLDIYSFVNAHCGANYSMCDWSAGPGNVHFAKAGFAALAGKVAVAIKAIAKKTDDVISSTPNFNRVGSPLKRPVLSANTTVVISELFDVLTAKGVDKVAIWHCGGVDCYSDSFAAALRAWTSNGSSAVQ